MSRKLINLVSIFATAAALTAAVACGDQLKSGSNDLDIDGDESEKVEDVSVTFSHPCAYVNAKDIQRIKNAVSAINDSDPVYVSYLQLCKSPYAQSSYTASPVAILVRGDAKGTGVDSENYIVADRDAAAAFQLGLRYVITGETAFADAAVAILNAWASTCTKITANDNNQYLLAGFQGHAFANAAELVRDYSGWAAADQSKFKTWLKNIWYAKNYWFIDNHGGSGVCDLHYWSNWELANLASILSIGAYLEDAEMINYANKQFLKGKGSVAVNNMIPYDPIADPSGKGGLIAQSMESGRDQGHATLVCSMAAEMCRVAQNVGLDFWGAENNKCLAMFEYTAKYNCKPEGTYIATSMPFTEYKYCVDCSCPNNNHGATHTAISPDGRGKERPCWDLIYAHYVKEAGQSAKNAYYTKLFADQLRYTDGTLTGDGGAGDSRYGSTSAAFDQLGWSTLLFYQGE